VLQRPAESTQYTSLAFTNRLEDLHLVPSFGSTGDCFDNAKMEAFWATLKREITWITGIETFDTRHDLRTAIFDYIEVFYNRQRHQAGLGHLTPNEYEQRISCLPNRGNSRGTDWWAGSRSSQTERTESGKWRAKLASTTAR